MSTDTTSIMGRFQTEEEVLSAIKEIEQQGWQVQEVFSPIPSHKINAAIKQKKSMVGWFTLTGGIIGVIFGFSLATYAASQWNLIVSGKPILAWIPWFVIGFEFTILFAVFGNVAGLLSKVKIPTRQDINFHPACSGSEYGVLVELKTEEAEKLQQFFQNKGATTS